MTTKEITKEEIQEIERLTGGMIGDHTFGPNNEHTLTNSFLSKMVNTLVVLTKLGGMLKTN